MIDPKDYAPHHAHEIRDILAGSRRSVAICYERYFDQSSEGRSYEQMANALQLKANEIAEIFQ